MARKEWGAAAIGVAAALALLIAVLVPIWQSTADAARTFDVACDDSTHEDLVDLGDVTGQDRAQYHDGAVAGEKSDVFVFTLAVRSYVKIGLRDLTTNIDLSLFDSSGTNSWMDSQEGTRKEWVARALDAGTYCIRVEEQDDANGEYRLRFGSKILGGKSHTVLSCSHDDRYANRGDVTDLGNIGDMDDPAYKSGTLAAGESDVYTFTMGPGAREHKRLGVGLRKLTGNADVYIVDNQNVIRRSSQNSGNDSEWVAGLANTGSNTWCIVVTSKEATNSLTYKLRYKG